LYLSDDIAFSRLDGSNKSIAKCIYYSRRSLVIARTCLAPKEFATYPSRSADALIIQDQATQGDHPLSA
jgi:hypothetical protein